LHGLMAMLIQEDIGTLHVGASANIVDLMSSELETLHAINQKRVSEFYVYASIELALPKFYRLVHSARKS
jgi:hypothetical protein